jgi:peptidoglycan/LPS O-acetylase OafA/YrhL
VRKLAVFLVAAIVLSAWWSHHLTIVNPVSAYYSPFTRFWEIALGALVSLAPVAWAKRTPGLNAAAAFVALVVILVAAVRFNDQSVYPGVLAWWPCAATAILLYTGQASSGGVVNWLSYRPCRYVGDISYSLYLWHFAWLMLPLQMVHPPATVFKVIELAGAFVCAVASYHLVENPIRRSKDLDRDGWSVVLLLVVCLAISWDATLIVGHLAHQSFNFY